MVGGGVQSGQNGVVVEVLGLGEPVVNAHLLPLIGGDAEEGLDGADSESVGGQPAADVVEERPHTSDVGDHRHTSQGRALGPGMDGGDVFAVDVECDAVDGSGVGTFVQRSHVGEVRGVSIRRTGRGSNSRPGGTGPP